MNNLGFSAMKANLYPGSRSSQGRRFVQQFGWSAGQDERTFVDAGGQRIVVEQVFEHRVVECRPAGAVQHGRAGVVEAVVRQFAAALAHSVVLAGVVEAVTVLGHRLACLVVARRAHECQVVDWCEDLLHGHDGLLQQVQHGAGDRLALLLRVSSGGDDDDGHDGDGCQHDDDASRLQSGEPADDEGDGDDDGEQERHERRFCSPMVGCVWHVRCPFGTVVGACAPISFCGPPSFRIRQKRRTRYTTHCRSVEVEVGVELS